MINSRLRTQGARELEWPLPPVGTGSYELVANVGFPPNSAKCPSN
jgi:hypothetical protein